MRAGQIRPKIQSGAMAKDVKYVEKALIVVLDNDDHGM
jgi:hypothetical protein